MKKIIGSFFAIVLVTIAVTTTPTQAYATVSSSTATTTPVVVAPVVTAPTSNLASLLATLKTLMAKVAELQAQLGLIKGEMNTMLKDGLKEGMTDEDIKELQALLASDPSIYPAGRVTGFFGPMTTEALKKFQLKNGLEVTGVIDTETKAALDTIMEQRKADGKIPLGFMFRPDMKEKFEHKLRVRCDDVIVASSTPSTVPCKKMKEKYKFEVDDKGRIKMEYEVEDENDLNGDSSDDEDDSTDDSDDSDESEDDSNDDSDDDN